MSFIKNIGICPVFGYESRFRYQPDSSRNKIRNLVKVMGYFPVLGVLFGSIKIYQAIRSSDRPSWQRVALAGRGIVEVCGIGVILLPIDLTKSVIDFVIVAQKKRKETLRERICNVYD